VLRISLANDPQPIYILLWVIVLIKKICVAPQYFCQPVIKSYRKLINGDDLLMGYNKWHWT